MSVARTMRISPGSTVVVLGDPTDVDLDLPGDCLVVSDAVDAAGAEAVLSFVVRAVDLDDIAGPTIAAARDDRLAWIAYPKSRQLGSDLNRDRLTELLAARGAQPVRAISVNAVWSALLLRPL